MAHPAPRVIEVPIDNSNDVLEIDCSQLPEHASEICDILENEGSALRFYRLFALEYYRQGLAEEAVVALKRGIASAKANDQTAKVPLLNFLAGVYVHKAKAMAAAPTAGAAPAADGGREMLLQMATALLTEAERMSRTDANTCLVKGMLAMAKRLPDAALIQFTNTLRIAPHNVAALLGKARVLYGRRQFQQALAIYQQALVLRPAGKPDPRIGIGMCLYRLGHTEDARRALARAIAVDPAAAAPHLLLATIDLNEIKRKVDPRIRPAVADPAALEVALGEAAGCLQRAMEHLQRAYEVQPNNAAALICLADRLFCKADFGGARRLAERALGTADTMAIQAEAQYQIGRAHHADKQFDLAYEAYQRCLALNERHSLARYGLGQMQLQRTDMSSAEATFQRVLEHHPRCVEVLRALGYLHARLPNTKAKALEYYEREMQVLADEAAEQAKSLGRAAGDVAEWFDDANLFLEAGLLYEGVSAKKARKAYAVAAQVLGRAEGGGGSDAIPELWNNLGALSQLTGEPDEAAAAAYGQATERCTRMLAEVRARTADRKGAHSQRPSNELRRLENTLTSTTYNVARFYEHCGLWERAERLYQDIVARIPAYTDARLRLAYIAFFYRGDSEGALAHIGQAIDADAKRPAGWLMRGSIELHRKNVQVARRAFEHVLKDISKHDVYALCSLGNYYLAAGKSESTRAANEPNTASAAAKKALDLAAQNYKRALEFFDKCLQLDERCAAAAHGAAIAIAERGFAVEARRLFQEVRDAATSGLGPLALCNPASDLVFKTSGLAVAATAGAAPLRLDDMRVGCDVLLWSGVNTAHACVEIGNYRQAILVYEACIKRIQETTATLENAGSAGDADRLIVAALEETAKGAQPEAGANAADGSAAVTVAAAAAAKMSKAERSERQRTTRDLRLYLVRAQYIQAKTTKDMDVLHAALREICALCVEAAISIPETDAKAEPAADNDAAAEDKADGDDDGDVEMGSAGDAAEAPAAAEEGGSKDPASRKPRVRMSPEDSLLLFDQALVEQLVAQLSSDLPASQRSLESIDTAASHLEHSTAAFTFLASWGKSMQKKKHTLLYSPRLASERAGYGKSLVAKLARKRQEQVDFERQRQENAEQWRKQQQEAAARKREEAERAERERAELEAKILRETEERNAILREQMAADAARQTTEAAAAPAGRSRKPKQRGDEDGFISDHDNMDDAQDARRPGAASDSESERQPAAPPREKKRLARGGRNRVRSKPADGHTDDEGAGNAPTPVSKKRRGPRAGASADGAEQLPRREAGPSNDRYKSKAIISDSDISDE